MAIWGIIAVFVLENFNVSLRGKAGEHYGSFCPYIFGWLAFFMAISVFEHIKNIKYTKEDRDRNDLFSINYSSNSIRNIKIISSILIMVELLCFSQVATKPYFILGIDRYAYNRGVLPGIVGSLLPLLFACIPIPLMIRKNDKKFAIAYLLLLSLTEIWVGEKFTGLIIIIYFVTISLNPKTIQDDIRKKLRKYIIGLLIVVSGLLIFVYAQQSVIGNGNNFARYLIDRVDAQGELWWLTYAGDHKNGTHFNEIYDEIKVLIYQPTGEMQQYYFGIYKLMKRFMNPSWVSYSLALNIRATESTRATFFYYGKYVGLFCGQVILAIIICFIVNRCIENCNKLRWLKAVLYMYILRSLLTAFVMSDFQLLTQKRILLVYLGLIFLELYKPKKVIHRST